MTNTNDTKNCGPDETSPSVPASFKDFMDLIPDVQDPAEELKLFRRWVQELQEEGWLK